MHLVHCKGLFLFFLFLFWEGGEGGEIYDAMQICIPTKQMTVYKTCLHNHNNKQSETKLTATVFKLRNQNTKKVKKNADFC